MHYGAAVHNTCKVFALHKQPIALHPQPTLKVLKGARRWAQGAQLHCAPRGPFCAPKMGAAWTFGRKLGPAGCVMLASG